MKRFEYKYFEFPCGPDDGREKDQVLMNNLGADGWEILYKDYEPIAGNKVITVILAKREL